MSPRRRSELPADAGSTPHRVHIGLALRPVRDRQSNPMKADSTSLQRLSAKAVKTGVSVGVLPDADRDLALGLAARCLPFGSPQTEAAATTLLKNFLSAEGRFLAVDAVELRRWLIDTGNWQRDGFGREYRRVSVEGLVEARQLVARALMDASEAVGELGPWLLGERMRVEAERLARRDAWQSQRAAGGTAAGTAARPRRSDPASARPNARAADRAAEAPPASPAPRPSSHPRKAR